MNDKSKTIKYPITNFDSSFIRGLSDSSSFICQAVEKLNSFGIKSRILPTKYDGLGRLVITRKSDAIKLREFLYPKNDVIHLERKRSIFSDVRYKKGGEG